jgi:hypothetical protein
VLNAVELATLWAAALVKPEFQADPIIGQGRTRPNAAYQEQIFAR